MSSTVSSALMKWKRRTERSGPLLCLGDSLPLCSAQIRTEAVTKMKEVSRVRPKGSFAQLKSLVSPPPLDTGSGSRKESWRWFSSSGSLSRSDKDLVSTVAVSPSQETNPPNGTSVVNTNAASPSDPTGRVVADHPSLSAVKAFDEDEDKEKENEKEDEPEIRGLEIIPMDELRDQPETTSPGDRPHRYPSSSQTPQPIPHQQWDRDNELRILELGKDDLV
jgi:hypothetical protein